MRNPRLIPIFLSALILATSLALQHPRAAHAQCGGPNYPPCPDEKPRATVEYPSFTPTPTETPTATPSPTPTSTPTLSSIATVSSDQSDGPASPGWLSLVGLGLVLILGLGLLGLRWYSKLRGPTPEEDGTYRVRVKFPWMTDESSESYWARNSGGSAPRKNASRSLAEDAQDGVEENEEF